MLITITLVNTLVVVIAVLTHYEALYRLGKWLPHLPGYSQFRMVICVGVGLVAHAIEIWLFALAYHFLEQIEGAGSLMGNASGTLLDCAYFSFATFTTVGFGDIYPVGPLRYLAGIESLTGLVLITWTASFLFMEMDRSWRT